MDNEKRILLAVALSIAVLFGYQYLFTPPQKKPEQGEMKTAVQEHKPDQAPQVLQPKPLTVPPPAAEQQVASAPLPGPEITIETGLFTAVFSRSSAGPASFKLHNYREALDPSAAERLVKKFFPGQSAPAAPSGQQHKELVHARTIQQLPLRTLFVASDGSAGSGPWQADKNSVQLSDRTRQGNLLFVQQDAGNFKISKQFSFSEQDYKFGLQITLENNAPSARTGNAVIEWITPAPGEGGGGFFGDSSNIPQFTYLLKDSVVKQELAKIKEEMPIEGDISWTAIEEKYFMSALLFQEQKPAQIRVSKTPEGILYRAYFPSVTIQPGQQMLYNLNLYMGPKDMDILAQQGAYLEKTLDFGWFDIIAKPLLVCLKFFYGFFGNYGIAIILLTVIIKILFWPLTHKSFKSMKGMQAIQPELTTLKEKYKDNKEEFARQQLALYRKYNINPLSGCLPIVIQIPVFIALYNALMYSIELRHANFISFWINDLSAKDPTYIAPIIMGLSQFLQQKMTPSASMDPMQAKMMLFMPLVFTVMFLSFPSGLVIYWLINNIISLAQQLYINKQISGPGGKECSPLKSKPKQLKKQ